MNYKRFLRQVHEIANPRDYLEIGVRNGNSLALARCNAVGVDPALRIKGEMPETVSLLQMKSDDYFHQLSDRIKYDMVFVDGMHLFEFAFRDVCNASRHLRDGGLIFMDDVLPGNQDMALRERITTDWTGDVWKVVEVVRNKMPEVNVLFIDTAPTGLALFYGDKLHNLSSLLDQHDDLVDLYANDNHTVPESYISRTQAVPAAEALDFIRNILKQKG